MRVVSALEVRARFGQICDEAAAGERIIIERAGHPVAAIVPLADLELVDPDLVRARQREAFERLMRLAKRAKRMGVPISGVDAIRADRDHGHSV